MLRQDLSDLLALRKPMQRKVLILRFGLLDNQEQSLAQIGERLNISRERVRQIQQQAPRASAPNPAASNDCSAPSTAIY